MSDEVPSARLARSKERIRAAATRLLVESGARAVTVEGVEAESGVARSTLYRHFASRDELLIDVVRSQVPTLPEPDLSVGFEPALRGLVGGIAESFARPEWSRVFAEVVSLCTSMPELEAVLIADTESHRERLARVLDLGVNDGVAAAQIDVDDAMNLLVGPLVLASMTGVGNSDISTHLSRLGNLVVDRFLASAAR